MKILEFEIVRKLLAPLGLKVESRDFAGGNEPGHPFWGNQWGGGKGGGDSESDKTGGPTGVIDIPKLTSSPRLQATQALATQLGMTKEKSVAPDSQSFHHKGNVRDKLDQALRDEGWKLELKSGPNWHYKHKEGLVAMVQYVNPSEGTLLSLGASGGKARVVKND